ncbi:MAG: amidase [Alphaproteobacteria bacterium]|nr:amidase [Alphaproteobacteria bacterium]
MTGLPFRSLTETAAAIAAGTVSSREVTTACLARIEAIDPQLRAFVALAPERALAAADAADQARAAGKPLGPLHGVPLAHKDMYYRAGEISGCGSKIRADWRPTETATVLERLDAAGAVTLGRLAMVEFAMGPHGYNQHLPQCRNPWNRDFIPCGSSSGSGVAVGGRMVFGSLGSDTGGSIRGPAAASGVVGLSPTNGRVSRHGAMPMSFSFDVVGPLARTVRDVARLTRVIAGADPRDASSADQPVPDYEAALATPIAGRRIGVPTRYFRDGLDPAIGAVLDASLAVLRELGATVVPVELPDWIYEASDLHPLVMKAEGAANHFNWMHDHRDDYSAEVGNRLEAGFFVLATDYIQAVKLRGVFLKDLMASVFAEVDMLHTPVMIRPLPTIEETRTSSGPAYLDMVVSLTRNTKVVNFLGLPGLTVPCGFDPRGLPVAFQLIGKPFGEPDMLAVAHHYEQAAGWWQKTPDL